MLTTTTTDDDDDLSPIKKVISINKNDSFDLINFNDSFNNNLTTPPIKQQKPTNDELDDLLEVNNSANESEDFWLVNSKINFLSLFLS